MSRSGFILPSIIAKAHNPRNFLWEIVRALGLASEAWHEMDAQAIQGEGAEWEEGEEWASMGRHSVVPSALGMFGIGTQR